MSPQPVVPATDAAHEPPTVTPTLLDAVRDLRRDVHRTRFPLEIPGVDEARAARGRLLDQLADHLLPRLEQLSTPAVVVAAGSTGAGKSTLVNSLIGTEVSASGVLRPTTRRPVLVHHPRDADLLADHPLLDSVDVVAHERVPRGIALLDAPDLDSVLAQNREIAHRLLEAADLWLFVTTAARYGDAVPWRVLEAAMARTASVAMVLNRVTPDALTTVRGDLLMRLRERGMDGVPLFTVPDAGPHEGLLDPSAVAPIHRWLTTLAGPDRARAVIARTLHGALASLRTWVDDQAEAVQAQADAAAALRVEVAAAVAGPIVAAEESVLAGALVDGPAGVRWTELASGPLAKLLGRGGRLRGWRRTAARREAALLELVEDLRASLAVHLSSVGAAGEVALRSRLTDPAAPAGAAALVAGWPAADHVAARERDAADAAASWVAEADAAVAALVPGAAAGAPGAPAASGTTGTGVPAAAGAAAPAAVDADRAASAVARLGPRGLAAVVLAAAAGLEPAARLLDAVLPGAGPALVDPLRATLAARAREGVAREGESLEEQLGIADLAPDAASRLRLRLAVLKGLT
ncbi:dynamin family protein [Cellulomonas sp. ATA003]|uniref:dynamin family protein n=1 Tax=Cellulomonas sp. ATA003 TaxID=3073064 RepID=UPI002873E2DA|nr:dynamin family protein [Cellulomonas sp. ATA003]WNB86717.1 dynamin family protein [Cellulomonas sp. ATA003]